MFQILGIHSDEHVVVSHFSLHQPDDIRSSNFFICSFAIYISSLASVKIFGLFFKFGYVFSYYGVLTVLFFSILFLNFYFIFKLYNIVLVLPNIEMNPPQVYMCSPS